MNTFKVCKEDVTRVAKDIGATLTDKEIEWVLLCYEDQQRQDPTGTWDLVVEDLIYHLENLKRHDKI